MIRCISSEGIWPIDMKYLVTEVGDATQATREGKLYFVDGGGDELA